MMTRIQRRIGLTAVIFMLVAAWAAVAVAQDAEQPEDPQAQLKEQWKDFLHYINVGRPNIAKSFGQAILDSATPKEIYLLSVQVDDSLKRIKMAEKLEGLGEMASAYRTAIEQGYKQWRSDPEQMEASIQMMTTLEGYRIAVERLKESGELAIPLLIEKLRSEQTPEVIRERIVTMLPALGREAVRGYSVVLQAEDQKLVQHVASALGDIGYPAAIPRLREALERDDLTEQTRTMLNRAVLSCAAGDPAVLRKPLAELFYDLAGEYYYRAESLRPSLRYPDEPGLVWFWKDGLVEARPVPQPILMDVYAMRNSRLALEKDPAFYPAVPLWLSAAIRRQLDLPEGETDALWPADQPQASYYALASSPRYLQMALARALKDGQVGIATKLIEAMSRNTGAQSLIEPMLTGAQPLVNAMGYPDQNVRYLAAETLALAMPTQPFTGYESVTDLLSEAVRQQGKKYVLLMATDEARRNVVKDQLRAGGYEIIEETDPDNLLVAMGEAPGVDAVFVGSDEPLAEILRIVRRTSKYRYLPVVVDKNTPDVRRLAEQDTRVVVLDADEAGEQGVADAMVAAMKVSAGTPLSPTQAGEWAVRAARAIREVGLRGPCVYDLTKTVGSLDDALDRDSSELQIAAAQALAVINTAEAQQAIIDLALNAQAGEEVRVAALEAASESVRRFGNYATENQRQTLVDMVTDRASQELMNAAAQLMGTMNLTSEKMHELIYTTDDID